MQFVVCTFDHVEERLSVGYEEGGSSQLFAKCGVVEQKQILQHEHARCLVVGMLSQSLAQFVKCFLVQLLGMFDEIL